MTNRKINLGAVLCAVLVDGEEPLTDEEFKRRFIAAAGKNSWLQLVAQAVSPVTAKIRDWREKWPDEDPTRNSKLMTELRQVYQSIPESAVKLEYVRAMAGELGLTIRQIEALIGGQPVKQPNNRELPPFKGVR